MGKPVPHKLEMLVVGLQHRTLPDTRRDFEARVKKGVIEIKIKREPDNTFDDNAIKVIISEGEYKGMHIGYIPRNVAAIMAPAIDQGDIDISTARGDITEVDAQNGTATMLLEFKGSVKMKKGVAS